MLPLHYQAIKWGLSKIKPVTTYSNSRKIDEQTKLKAAPGEVVNELQQQTFPFLVCVPTDVAVSADRVLFVSQAAFSEL